MKRWTLVLGEVCIRPASKHDDAPATLSPSGRPGRGVAAARARRRRDAVSRAIRTANDANARARHIARDDLTAGRRNDARGSMCGVPRFELEARPRARSKSVDAPIPLVRASARLHRSRRSRSIDRSNLRAIIRLPIASSPRSRSSSRSRFGTPKTRTAPRRLSPRFSDSPSRA